MAKTSTDDKDESHFWCCGDDDEHYTALLQVLLPRLDNDEYDPCQA